MWLNSGMMKRIFSTKTRRLFGVHILGEGAAEAIHFGQAVLNLKGISIISSRTCSTIRRRPKPTRLPGWRGTG